MQILKLFFILLLSINSFAKPNLSSEEKEWILNNPLIKVGVDENWPPFDFVNKEGVFQGISSEHLDYISRNTGLNFEIYSNKWEKVLKKIKNKELDILACASDTIQRREYLNFTIPYISVDMVVVTRNDFQIDSFEDISSYKIALPENNFVHDKLKKEFPNAEFIFTKSNEEAIESVSFNKADIYVGNLPVVSHFIEKNLLTNLLVAFKAPLKKTTLSIAVSKDNNILLSILNKSLSSIPLEEKQKYQKKWINNKLLKENKNKKISFTLKEKKWLRNNKTIKIAGDPSWPPYSYTENSEYKGIVPDLVEEVFKDSEINIEYIPTKTWSETLTLAKKGEVDLVDAISFSKKRLNYLNFATTFLGTEIVIVSNRNHDEYVNTIKNILNKKIGIVKNYAVVENIKSDYPNLETLYYYETALDGLKKLSNSQIDYFIIDIPSFEYYIKKYSLSNLKIIGPSGYNFNYGFGVKKDDIELLSIMNKLIKNVSDEKKDEIYRKWVKFDYKNKIDYELIWKIIIISFFVIAGTVYWNRKLQIEIKEKEKVQKDLQDNKDLITSIMDSQHDIIITTTGKDLKQVNKSFLDFFEYENLNAFKQDHKGICDFFHNQNSSEYLYGSKANSLHWLDEVLENPHKIHKVVIYKNEVAHIFKITASYILHNKKLKTVVFTDITKLEELNDVLKKAKNDALNIAKQKSEFLANMSHEIRTPMNSVIGFTELLDKEISNPIQKDYLNSIKKGGNSLLRIINDILDLSKIEAGKLEIKNESLNPKSLFLEIESIFHSKIISKNISFIVDIDKNIPNYIILDGVRLRQVLFNLIGNAIKFTDKGYIKLKVKNLYKNDIKSKIDLIFSVEDSGIGIDETSINNIFNSFEQQKEQDTMKYGGTGLGLAICKNLVSMMNGEIKVSSKKAEGSIFEVILSDVAVSSVGEVEVIDTSLDVRNIVFENARVLVVDDVIENRKLVEATLKDYSLELVMAENGKEAISILNNINIDLILMDLRMPIMSGYEAAVLIKDDNKLKDIPLLALTASVMGKDLEKVSSYGFDAYLRKPVILNDLINKLSDFLPHTLKTEKKDNDYKIECLDIESLNTVVKKLENELKDEWLDVKDKGDFTLISDFAKNLNNIARNNHCDMLINYSDDLITYIDSFDIERVDFMMNTYLDLVKKIKNQREELERG